MSLKHRSATVGLAVALLASVSFAPSEAQGNVANSLSGIADLSGVLRGSGSTFAARYYTSVIASVERSAKNVKIEYHSIGYILNEGQDLAVRADYARLPEPLRLAALARIDRINAR